MKSALRVFCGLVAIAAVVFGFVYRPQNEIQNRQDTTWLLSLLVAGIALLGVMWVGRGPFTNKRGLDPEDRLRHYVQRVSSVLIVGFILISLQLLRQQVVIANEIEKPFNAVNSQGEDVAVQDPRLINETLSNQRGRIFDAAGNEVAGISTSKYKLVKRTYADSPVKQLLGYFSPLQFGNSGLEAEYDDYLSGEHGSNPFANLQRSLLNEPTQGNNLYLTVDPKLQQLAQDTLGPIPGSIVLLDGKSGAVLAMVGYPRYDPSQLVFDPTVDDSLWNDQIQAIQQRWNALNNDPSQPLYMRPTQGLYVPGSIFKTVTLSGMLDTGKTKPDSTWKDAGSFVIDAYKINDPNRPNQNTTWTTQQGYMFSLNAVFAQMGVALGPDGLRDYANKFGFGQEIPFDLKTSASQIESTKDYLASRVAQAETGFGQGQLQITPLHAALMAAAMGRGDGIMPKPYLVQSIKTPAGQLIKETEPSNWLQTVRPETAKTVHDIMVASATDGWVGLNGGNLKGSGAVIGGKTGTAELGNNLNNAWYIAWASKGDKLFAIAVVIDHRAGGEGLQDAMPRANKVLTAALAGVK
jgi:peptidoglycan glycosyltransferase